MIQALYLVNCRSLRHSLLSIGLFRNGRLWLGIAGALLLQAGITYLPFLNSVFRTAPIDSHVNIDTIYVYLPRRWQAGLDSAGYLLLFFPYFFIFLYAGMDLAAESIAAGDRTVTGVPIIVSVMKTLMPVCSFFMLLQGLAQFVRSVHLCVSGREL